MYRGTVDSSHSYKYAHIQNIHTPMLTCTQTQAHTCSNTHTKLEVLKTDERSLGL